MDVPESQVDTLARQIEDQKKRAARYEQALEKAMKENASTDVRADLRSLLESATLELKALRDKEAASIQKDRDKEAALINEHGAIVGAKVKEWSNAPFYSTRLAKFGFVTPGEQYATYCGLAGTLVAVGYSVNSFMRAREVIKMSKFKEGSQEWLHHKARAWVTAEQAKNAHLLIKQFLFRGSVALFVPGLVLVSMLNKFTTRKKL